MKTCRTIATLICFIAVCSTCAADVGVAARDTRPSLVVLGIASTGKSKEWREGLAGFGIENWVAQALYDCGKYRLMEQRPDVLATYQPKLADTYDLAAMERKKDLQPLCEALKADVIVVGKVVATWPERSRAFVGIISNDTRDTVIKVDVCLYDMRTGKSLKASGTGKAGHSSHAFVADRPGGLAFDPETVGIATNKAVEDAVSKLVPEYRPRDRSTDAPLSLSPVSAGVLPLAMTSDVALMYPELKTKRVQLGIHNRIVKEIGETPQCTLQEVNPDVLATLETQWWVAANGAPPASDVTKHAADLRAKADWLVYGEVFTFSAAQVESMSGLSGKLANKITIGVQLRAVNVNSPSQAMVMASGTGTSMGDWNAWKGQDIDFEQTFVGESAQKAIKSAWRSLACEIAAAQKRTK
ncbi:MAG TPA: hypothetical protein VGK19_13060 [Capsulimonadaceae bacterium]|jgi:hypothetical protein